MVSPRIIVMSFEMTCSVCGKTCWPERRRARCATLRFFSLSPWHAMCGLIIPL